MGRRSRRLYKSLVSRGAGLWATRWPQRSGRMVEAIDALMGMTLASGWGYMKDVQELYFENETSISGVQPC